MTIIRFILTLAGLQVYLGWNEGVERGGIADREVNELWDILMTSGGSLIRNTVGFLLTLGFLKTTVALLRACVTTMAPPYEGVKAVDAED
jgi:hypothetical protein